MRDTALVWPMRTPGQSVAHVIVRCAGEAVSLVVDVEDEVVDVDDEAFEHVPATLSQSIGSLLTGIYKLDCCSSARARHRSRSVGGGLRTVADDEGIGD